MHGKCWTHRPPAVTTESCLNVRSRQAPKDLFPHNNSKTSTGGALPMTEVVIVSATRTLVGAFNGSLSSLSAHKLGEIVIRKLLESAGIAGNDVSEVILGQILTATAGQNPARQASV